MDNAGPDGAIFWISFAVVILQRRKVVKCVQFTRQRAISQKLNDVCNKTLRLALEYVENCRSRYRLSLSVAWIVRFWFKSFQNLTIRKTSLVQGSLFLLAVYTHEVPVCLCSVFCSRSQVRLSTARYRAFGAPTTPRTVSSNLNVT